ncbi:AAA family ATPase [Chondromyces apiculatus]|uniref:MoxR protein n=1 Tax=Chondromyces apiculatus DSM 436 TaxID=1192034 RepID=A0A017T5T4_9BACT|nr:MoxR family ATPase [Chondromyces apiculatus]EYF04613.1 MoxR protein [Chondromyces apiculatus DSM 436]
MSPDELNSLCERLKEQIGRIVVGQEAVVEALLVSLLSGGHILLEGVPGTAKTLLAQTFAASLDLGMKRVQFTPDLMPGDVIGANLFNFQTSQFTLTRGPLFTDFLLADEINRTPPKTQAALLQAMQERAVTVDGVSHPLSDAFLVVATQNPVEQEGTYPLPEAQLDRFLLKIVVGYPSRDEEREIVRRHGSRTLMPDVSAYGLSRIADHETLAQARTAVAGLHLSDELIDYVVDLVRATRQHTAIQHGASPRSATMLATASRALASLRGRTFVIPDDVKELFLPAMRHRIVLSPGAEVEGATVDATLRQILVSTPAPR